MARIDSILPPSLPGSFGKLDAEPGRRDGLHGATTKLISTEIALEDGAEELSLHLADKAENKHHAERKVKGQPHLQILDIDAIIEFMSKTREIDAQEKLIALAKRIMAGADPHQAAAQAFKGATAQFVALQFVLDHGSKLSNSPQATLNRVREALEDLIVEHGSQIRASLNTVEVASSFSQEREELLNFQRVYVDQVLGGTSLAKTLDKALDRLGANDINRGIAHLILAAGQDLASVQPSTDRVRLNALLRDLYQLQVVTTVLDKCLTIGDELGPSVGAFDATRLMRDVVALTEDKWATESRFSNMAQTYGVVRVEDRIVFLKNLQGMLKELPTQVYLSDETRQSILTAAQYAFDSTSDEEHQ